MFHVGYAILRVILPYALTPSEMRHVLFVGEVRFQLPLGTLQFDSHPSDHFSVWFTLDG